MKNHRYSNSHNHTPRNILAHLLIIVAMVILVCFVTDQINPDMELISSTRSKWVIGGLSVLAIINGICTVVALWKRPKDE